MPVAAVEAPATGAEPASFTVSGLQRYLIIFADHTLVLDQRTGPCITPSPQVIPQRSKNFTSGASISITPSISHPYRSVPEGGPSGWEDCTPEGPGLPQPGCTSAPHCPSQTPRLANANACLVDPLSFHAGAYSQYSFALDTLS